MIAREEDVIDSFANFPKLAKRSYHTAKKIPRKAYLPTLKYLLCDRDDYHFKELSEAVHVSENLLRHWQVELQKDRYFHPADLKYTNKRNRKLSNELEDVMIQFIEKYYLKPGYYFDNRICRGVCYKIWLLRAKGKDHESNFKASRNWATRFMNKYGYSLRKAHRQCWIIYNREIEMDNWVIYCKEKQHSINECRAIKHFIMNDIIGGSYRYNGGMKSFLIKFLQGVSYIDTELFLNKGQLIWLMKLYSSYPTRRLVFIVSAFKKKTPDYESQESDVKEFIAGVNNSCEEDYSDYDNGNDLRDSEIED